ncbi:hypothetical protein XENTR_v10000637 [Xenopus tropicalis]|nr:hypothetical protein XENTR_v10000637 [Xenopus tropicalis]
MKRKQKRFIQATVLFMVTLILLPNIGLWSIYKDRQLMKSADAGDQQLQNCNSQDPPESIQFAVLKQ